MATRNLIVTGATGKQGGALINALLAQPKHPFTIYAVTRSTTSASAQRLAKRPNVKVIQGDFTSPAAFIRQVDRPWGLFAMTDFSKGVAVEEQQGKALVAAAVDAGIRHIVFTATERGGQKKSDNTPTYVPHFRSKYHIEQDIVSAADASGGKLTYTFLRPVAFFENLSPDFFGKAFIAMLKQNGPDRPLQQISTADIGKVAAEAFLHVDKEEYRNKAVSLAGDEVSPNEMARIFEEVTGERLPETWWVAGWLVKLMSTDMRLMFRWFVEEDFGVDVQAVRKRYPFMRDFRGWLGEESAWKKT